MNIGDIPGPSLRGHTPSHAHDGGAQDAPCFLRPHTAEGSMRARLSPSRAGGWMTGQARHCPAHPERRGGAMRIRTVRLSPIAVGVAVLLPLAAPAAPLAP